MVVGGDDKMVSQVVARLRNVEEKEGWSRLSREGELTEGKDGRDMSDGRSQTK